VGSVVSFVYAAGPRQRSLSRVRVQNDSLGHSGGIRTRLHADAGARRYIASAPTAQKTLIPSTSRDYGSDHHSCFPFYGPYIATVVVCKVIT
jgi:hypothetical protein